MRRLDFLLIISLFALCSCQSAKSQFWYKAKVDITNLKSKPSKFATYKLSSPEFLKQLNSCGNSFEKSVALGVPGPDGSIRQFKVWQNSTLSPGLLKKYPQMKTFQGVLDGDNSVKLRMEYVEENLKFMVFGSQDTWFVYPVDKQQDTFYAYFKRDLPRDAKSGWTDTVINSKKQY